MQEHHRELIRREAEAWKADAHLHGTLRFLRFTEVLNEHPRILSETPHYFGPRRGLIVHLVERDGLGSQDMTMHRSRTTVVAFAEDEMPLTARMIRERFANPFGAKG